MRLDWIENMKLATAAILEVAWTTVAGRAPQQMPVRIDHSCRRDNTPPPR